MVDSYGEPQVSAPPGSTSTLEPSTCLAPALPEPRGPLTEFLLDTLRRPTHHATSPPMPRDHPICGEDSSLALYLCYELHYRGFGGVDDRWEWEPSLLAVRRSLEGAFIDALFDEVGPPVPCADVESYLHALVSSGSGPSLSEYVAVQGSIEQFREFAVHRSAYQLKEADPHSWALPRLQGRPKAALATIQFGEYGDGHQDRIHASLFVDTLSRLGLDPTYGRYIDQIPGVTLSTVNLVSLFGLHRRWRGALVGHLAVFEMASVGPNTRYGNALRRLGFDAVATRFYDTHVTADAIHEIIAATDLAGGLAAAEPGLSGDIAFGARAIMATEGRFSRHLLAAWRGGRCSLRRPLPT